MLDGGSYEFDDRFLKRVGPRFLPRRVPFFARGESEQSRDGRRGVALPHPGQETCRWRATFVCYETQ
jgi:hypothetical protein